MKKIYSKKQLKELKYYDTEVIKSIERDIEVLKNNYGVDRNVDNDLGGYVLIVENIIDIKMLKVYKLKGLIPEYTDVIEVVSGNNYTLSLYLLSSDLSITVVTNEELSKFLLE